MNHLDDIAATIIVLTLGVAAICGTFAAIAGSI
jgi:hypothetical protein